MLEEDGEFFARHRLLLQRLEQLGRVVSIGARQRRKDAIGHPATDGPGSDRIQDRRGQIGQQRKAATHPRGIFAQGL